MKILFSNAHQLKKGLEKSEIIALVHLLHKLSESLAYYKAFLQIEKDQDFKKNLIKHSISYLGVVLIFAICKLYEINQHQIKKEQEDKLLPKFEHLKDAPKKKKI